MFASALTFRSAAGKAEWRAEVMMLWLVVMLADPSMRL